MRSKTMIDLAMESACFLHNPLQPEALGSVALRIVPTASLVFLTWTDSRTTPGLEQDTKLPAVGDPGPSDRAPSYYRATVNTGTGSSERAPNSPPQSAALQTLPSSQQSKPPWAPDISLLVVRRTP